MPRVSIAVEDSPNAGDWSAEYIFREDEVEFYNCKRDGVPVPCTRLPDVIDAALCAAARAVCEEDQRDLAGEQTDLRILRRKEGDR